MIYAILWMLTGLSMAGYWIYVDVTKKDNAYNLKELLCFAAVSSIHWPLLIGISIYEKHREQIVDFFNNPIVGRKK